MNFKTLEQVKFELLGAVTWGVTKDEDSLIIPVVMRDFPETLEKIEKLVKYHDTKNPLYGESKTLYLKSKSLSNKQYIDLFDKGRQHIMVGFMITGVYTKNGKSYLVFKVTKLRKLEDSNDWPED